MFYISSSQSPKAKSQTAPECDALAGLFQKAAHVVPP